MNKLNNVPVLLGLIWGLIASPVFAQGQRIVVVCTGHGLKDPDIIIKRMGEVKVLPARSEALEDAVLASPPTPSPGTQIVR